MIAMIFLAIMGLLVAGPIGMFAGLLLGLGLIAGRR